ncbi:conserved hypothetical protein, partial [delta proteobacterium NaphS2]
GKFYFVAPEDGKASGNSAAGREYINTFYQYHWEYPIGYHPFQKQPLWVGGAPYYVVPWLDDPVVGTEWEAFNAIAYATTQAREVGLVIDDDPGLQWPGAPGMMWGVAPAYMRMVPRWYLYTSTGEDNIFVWKSVNQTASSPTDTYTIGGWTSVGILYYDNNENYGSDTVDLSKELNILDVKAIVPTSWQPATLASTDAAGGWIDIPIPMSRFGYAVEILAWNWQRAYSENANLNWSALFEVNRDVGSLNFVHAAAD